MQREWTTIQELRLKLLELLYMDHFGLIQRFDLDLVGDTFIISGEVGSEQTKSDAKRFALGFENVFKVRNELEVAGYFAAASDDEGSDFFGNGDDGVGLGALKS
ncbi:BON domain-containing protein, partial [Escherichia coli]|uniref:BON domain-containing protein n=1 Tax=Escherichia coli TaxID=562 RepID=UPI00190CF7B0